MDSPDSFQNVLERWSPEVRHFCPGVPIILVATKKDLRYKPDVLTELRRSKQKPVTEDQGQHMAQQISAVKFLECSALQNVGVMEIFDAAARAALAKPKKSKPIR